MCEDKKDGGVTDEEESEETIIRSRETAESQPHGVTNQELGEERKKHMDEGNTE